MSSETNSDKRDNILKQLISSARGIQDAVLVDDEALVINNPLQEWDEDSASGMATAMFFLRDSTREHLHWSVLTHMLLETEEAYFIGVPCSQETFLLVQASKVGKLGEIRRVINRAVKQLQSQLKSEECLDTDANKGQIAKTVLQEDKTQLPDNKSLTRPKPEANSDVNSEIKYRNRRISN
ncbi:MAG: hypothetical protein F6K36_01885 [Symploca sp. SIO3C6]|uniref:Roadblock/LAMTOR2 domain-containing protein n=1 Tax=Symploca sp. SIO1C4 TaxID=2607765 RepID=A0A6B3NCL9_9CYAN|nr:hypothetical protein [Symploca sp. SIO3C6]NER30839.1 hypothetical protein [Symploca sp. SIO1C4]NET05157.1 hypothetical protein [Symploca sp. SIO2B6]